MAITDTTSAPRERSLNRPMDRTNRRAVMYSMGTSASVEGLAAIGGVTLTILGLAGVLPFAFAAISSIVIGAGLMLEGMGIAATYAEEVRRDMISAPRRDEAIIGSGFSAQMLGGAAGVTLGILALAGVAPWTLLGVSTLAIGAALLLGGPVRAELVSDDALTAGDGHIAPRRSGQIVKGSGSGMALAGLAAIALGVLALAKVGPSPVLVLVAFLVASGASLLGGAALLGRVIGGTR